MTDSRSLILLALLATVVMRISTVVASANQADTRTCPQDRPTVAKIHLNGGILEVPGPGDTPVVYLKVPRWGCVALDEPRYTEIIFPALVSGKKDQIKAAMRLIEGSAWVQGLIGLKDPTRREILRHPFE